ncbi:50S ribosomal protein L15 [Candidatus Dependentiae bacterium]|nr:50S ribosomal protein L15 [Candidatus Dependentiae bacterium]
MNLSQLKKPKSKRSKKRVGRGQGSGHGKTAGRGTKGAKSRSGFSKNPGFQGGDISFIRKMPKRGMSRGSKQNRMRHIKEFYVPINVAALNIFDDNTTVTKELLVEKKLIKSIKNKVKILGTGDLKKKLIIEVDLFSKSAIEKIEKIGGEHKEVINV